MYMWMCVLERDDSAYEIRMNDRISHFTSYQWQLHKVSMNVSCVIHIFLFLVESLLQCKRFHLFLHLSLSCSLSHLCILLKLFSGLKCYLTVTSMALKWPSSWGRGYLRSNHQIKHAVASDVWKKDDYNSPDSSIDQQFHLLPNYSGPCLSSFSYS